MPPEPHPKAAAVPADATIRVAGGAIKFYSKYNNFEAICSNPGHGCCVMRRTPLAKTLHGPDGLPRGGRPIGFLVAWLSLAMSTGSREEHKDKLRVYNFTRPVACRMRFRDIVRLDPSSPVLFGKERGQEPGELEEQADLVDLWARPPGVHG
eukprot:7818968-Pyramimonas_sp.AAC.1